MFSHIGEGQVEPCLPHRLVGSPGELDPPYLLPATSPNPSDERFLGRYSLEGSRPGAAAAATWLSHKVVPLDEVGYGHLIERTVVGAQRLHRTRAAADLSGCKAVMLPLPDINIVNFTVRAPEHRSFAEVNAFNERLYRHLSGSPGHMPPPYFVTRTRLTTPTYDGAMAALLNGLNVGSIEEWRAEPEGLVVLRMTVMDPWHAEAPPAPDHVAGFVAHLAELCRDLRSEQ